MRAKFIYEGLNFERGQDPKTAMDIGILKRDISSYNYGNLQKYIIECLPYLFDNPEDLIPKSSYSYLDTTASNKLQDFIEKRNIDFSGIDFNVHEFVRRQMDKNDWKWPIPRS